MFLVKKSAIKREIIIRSGTAIIANLKEIFKELRNLVSLKTFLKLAKPTQFISVKNKFRSVIERTKELISGMIVKTTRMIITGATNR